MFVDVDGCDVLLEDGCEFRECDIMIQIIPFRRREIYNDKFKILYK